MMLPNVNMTTPRRVAVERTYRKASYALMDALKALEDSIPSSMDYTSREAYMRALGDHSAAYNTLRKVYRDFRAAHEGVPAD